MTISYQRDVASSTAGGFTRLLFKWKGSLYKLIYRELLLFLSAYILLSLTYRKLLNNQQRELFEMVVKYFDAFLNLVPLSFVLGFYVSYVAGRWWQQFLAIPWPDKLFHSIACFVEGFDEDSRILRRSLMRYMNLALILVLRSISSAVKQRFPTLEHVVEAGFMTNQEKELFQVVPCNEFNTYWIPCTWFVYRIQEAAKKGKLLNEYAIETIMREFCEFRSRCGLLWCYDWVSIPMVYTQTVTLATYVFFIFTVIGRQKLDGIGINMKTERMQSGRLPMDIDIYIPVYTILQFFFYMGLLKVAEQLINPFGDDDEDFELNWLVDRHMKASFLGCDILMDPDRIPPMVKDYYWDKQNCPIPYTEASMHFKRKTYKGSAADVVIPESKQHMVLPEIEEEAEDPSGRRASKLSLTSLLLDTSNILTRIGLGDVSIPAARTSPPTVMPYPVGSQIERQNHRGYRRSLPDGGASSYNQFSERRSPKNVNPLNYHPGSWRGGAAGPPQPEGINGLQQTGPSGTIRGADQLLNKLDNAATGANLLSPPEMPFNAIRRTSEGSAWGTSISVESGSEEEEDCEEDAKDSTAAEDGGTSAGNGAGTDGASDGAGERRGSNVKDLLDKRKKGDRRRRKPDKQGFVWRRMVHDQEDLPRQRTPSLGLGAAAYINQPPAMENPNERPSRLNVTPQSAPPKISFAPPNSNTNELSEESAALLAQKPPPPTHTCTSNIPADGPAPQIPPHSHSHRPVPQQRPQKNSQGSSMDSSLQTLQMQVPSGFRTGIVDRRRSPFPEPRMLHQQDSTESTEPPPPLVPIQLPNPVTAHSHGYVKDHPEPQYGLEQPRAPQQLIQPPHPAARPQGPAFSPRQGSAPPRFAGPPQPATFANGSGDRVRSTSSSSGPPGQPLRKGSNTTDAGARKSRSRSAVDEPKLVGNSYRATPPEDNSYRAIPRNSSKNSSQEIPPEDSISAKTFRQRQIEALSDSYNERASKDDESLNSADRNSGKTKFSIFKSDEDKSEELINALRRSNAYAAEKSTSPKKQFNNKTPQSEIGLVPQPFGTPRSPPVSSNTLEEAQRQMVDNPQFSRQEGQ